MTTDNAFTERFFEEHKLRMSACWWLAAFPRDRAPDELQDSLFDSLFDEDLVDRLFPRAADDLRGFYEDEDEPLPGELVEAIKSNNYLGFLVCIESPTEPEGTWGSYHMLWGYGETLREAIYDALRFLDRIRTKKWDSYESIAGLYMGRSHD